MSKMNRHSGRWQKRSVRTFPPHIDSVVKNHRGPYFVGAAKWITENEVLNNEYSHLGFHIDSNGDLQVPTNGLVPTSSSGSRAKWNQYGKKVTRSDLPKVKTTQTIHNPRAFGYLPITYTRTGYFYPKEQRYGKKLNLYFEVLETAQIDGEKIFIVGCRLHGHIKKVTKKTRHELLFRISLMQEQFGAVNLFATKPTSNDLRSIVFVNWNLLPPGLRTVQIAHALSKSGHAASAAKPMLQRIDWIRKQCPSAEIFTGHNMFSDYFMAKISDNCVIAENVHAGNAVYVFKKDWKKLSRKTKGNLVQNHSRDVQRIVHDKAGRWKTQLGQIIKKHCF